MADTGDELQRRCFQADTVDLCIEHALEGRAMNAAQVSALFQPFNRLGRDQSDVEGTGIGLAIARGLAGLMAGTLTVTSRPGVGSLFRLDLPAGIRSARPASVTDLTLLLEEVDRRLAK